MGAAILDYQKEKRAGRLHVRSTMFEDDEMPVARLWRRAQALGEGSGSGKTGIAFG